MTAATETGGPRREVTAGDSQYTLLGTAHVSQASADEVAELIRSGDFDAVAIELCQTRYQSLTNPDSMAQMDLFQVIREGKAGMVAASLALGAYQQRIAEQSGIQPGAEMRAAITEAKAAGIPVMLVDRDIGTTLRRVYHSVPWWQRFGLISGLMASLVSRQDISAEEIERLKEGDVLESTFAEFAERSERLYRPLIAERDSYMALRLREENQNGQYRNVLVVIGAGHLKGLANHLEAPAPAEPARERDALDTVPRKTRWPKAIPWVVVALILSGFAIGFSRNPQLGAQLVGEWFLINGVLSAAATAIAWAHPLTILGTFFAAPLTSLNPTIGAGFVAAGIEMTLRKPTVGDFATLRRDVAALKGWWRNRVSRTLLVFLLATFGSAAGTYIAGFRIFEQLISS
ncbi:TraB/GumN family protein [Aquisalimonas asiatica]|uniref:Pheromone shutdown-related protein TraB n=1 Tax=Aquisalimonas asiatica TaxID=406100 RepID=A0A1H8TKB1_9GAMM|nr:TraB/GumN family protein [Aquisalimonas asiatica]SEO91510.1 pheromone shutdown-related protein TraB [Aquisalimonas asiatica]